MSPGSTTFVLSVLVELFWTAPAVGQRFMHRPGQRVGPPAELASPTVASDTPSGRRTYLGIVGDDSRGPGSGASVLSVQSGGPADVAGILPGDVITAVAGIPVRNLDQLARKIQEVEPGRVPISDRVGGPGDDTAGTRGVPPRSTGGREVDELRRQVDSMQGQITLLKQQLAEMKARLEAVEQAQ